MQPMKRKYYLGIGLGLLHLILVASATLSGQVNDLPWIWMLLFPVDFPISLLNIVGLDVMREMWGDVVWDEAWKNAFYNYYWPVFVHGVIGSLWWGMIPIVVTNFLDKPQHK